ncbi:hypothetical protein, partial [Nitrospira sp. BLG_2]|uniref:hypothetical protein n=1 Tax=Nitrospira sp. BLG_2 TaxID=3397507 RepID=UPI003B99E57E
MVSANTGYIAHPLGDVMRGTFSKPSGPDPNGAVRTVYNPEQAEKTEPASASESPKFSDELTKLLANAVGAAADQIKIQETTKASPDGKTNGSRQFIVTVDTEASGEFGPKLNGPLIRALEMTPDAGKFDYDPAALVKDRLEKMGVDTSGIKFEQWEDRISNIGGRRTFNYLRAYLPNGMKEDFSLEWTLYNPDIT